MNIRQLILKLIEFNLDTEIWATNQDRFFNLEKLELDDNKDLIIEFI